MGNHVAIEDVAVEPEPFMNRKDRRKAANRAKQGTRPRVQHLNRKDVDPVLTAISHSLKLTEKERKQCIEPGRQAFDILRQGKATVDDVFEIVDSLNIAMQLTNPGIGLLPDHREKFSAAMDACVELSKRVEASGKWTCYAHELTAIDVGLEFYAIQLDFVSGGELKLAYTRMNNKIRGARSGSANKVSTQIFKGMDDAS